MTVAHAMTECLKAEGITELFGYPGAAICPFYDELYKTGICHILVRHEVNAGHAASGYARVTGKPAVCVATSGPGALNLITAIATAYMDSVPMVIITGQVNSEQIGRDVFQEADITGSAEPFVKHSYLLKRPEDTAETFKRAFYIAGTGRRGPVLIDVPFDVQQAEIDFEYPETVDIRSYRPSSRGNGYQIKRAITALKEAQKPLICAGGGLFTGNGAELMRTLAEKADIPVVSTMMGLGAMPSDSPLYYGMLGMHGRKAANNAVNSCDTLFLLGARVGDRAIAAMEQRSDLTVVHIDIDPAEIGKNIEANIPIVGDITLVLEQLLEQVNAFEQPLSHGEWRKKLDGFRFDAAPEPAESGYVNPKWFIQTLDKYLPERSVIVADVGQNQIWTAANISLKQGRFLTSGGMGTMGYSLPAAIGAKCADKTAEVIAVCGDGSFQMQLMELATAVQHGVNVKVIVMRNRYLGMVREVQERSYENRLVGVSLDGSPDFRKIADAYGIENMLADSEESAVKGVERLISSDKPFLLEVAVPELEKTIL
ncbi:MAG: biosynthetic-type acetolactate synthase large subunit [Lachnospiraceae bacterium]|nr:biosynthetic-type acetolactate synthase large subunit [Ruminococcus sp.]MCM1274722.1 biosynthetic-type acetolactate synthase large subunit [Lachnospiraceae bacterium]